MKISKLSIAVLMFCTVFFISSFVLAQENENPLEVIADLPPDSIMVKISLPDLFDQNRMDKFMDVYSIGEDKNKQLCNFSESNNEKPSYPSYLYECFLGNSYLVEINNLVPISKKRILPKKNKTSGFSIEEINIKPTDLAFYVFHPDFEPSIVSYWLGEKKIFNETSVEHPLKQVNNKIRIIPKTQDGKITFDNCAIEMDFFLGNILYGRAPVIAPDNCALRTVIWPKNMAKPQKVTLGCEYSEVTDEGAYCFGMPYKDVEVSWGDRWKKNIIPVEKFVAGSFLIDPLMLTPNWPVKSDDPWLSNVSQNEITCESKPLYNPASAWLCTTKTFDAKTCKNVAFTQKDGIYTFNSLKEIGWNNNGALPEALFIDLVKKSNNPRYKNKLRTTRPFSLLPGDIYEFMFKDKFDTIDLTYPVSGLKTPVIPYDYGSKLLLFENEKSCNYDNLSSPPKASVYRRDEIERVKTFECSWAKVVKGGEDVSFCTEAVKKDKKISFTLIPNVFEGKRHVIVIANSFLLGDGGRGSAIQEGLIAWLNEQKQGKRPLNVLVIEGNGKIKQVLSGEDLIKLELSSNEENPPPTIEGKIKVNITFNASGFKPLTDLEHVERALDVLNIKDLEKVLYFTNSSKEEKVYYADLGTPLGWMKEGISVSIVTDNNCNLWTKRTEIQCTSLNQSPDKNLIKKIFKNF